MPFADYLRDPAVSRSQLLDLAQHGPAAFHALHVAPDRPPPDASTPAQIAGRLAHTVTLEPHLIAQQFVEKPPGHDGRTTAGKQWNANVERLGLEVVTDEQMQCAIEQRRRLRDHPHIGEFLANPEARTEVSVFWTDPQSSVQCKARIDLLVPYGNPIGSQMIVIDLKTARDISPDGFGRDATKAHYDVQGAFYSEGVERATGARVSSFGLAAVWNKPPHSAMLYTIDRDALEPSRAYVRAALTLLATCRHLNAWPVFGDPAQELTLPGWHTTHRLDDIAGMSRVTQYVRGYSDERASNDEPIFEDEAHVD
jgi:hypothetical protein